MGKMLLLTRSPAEFPTKKRPAPNDEMAEESRAKRVERCPSDGSLASDVSARTVVESKLRFIDVRPPPAIRPGIQFR